MSRTVSFRCSEALDEFLEQEAERRMTTKSSVAQKLLAERAKELMEQRSGGSGSEGEPGGGETDEPGDEEDGAGEPGLPSIFDEFSEHWHYSDGDNKFAVRTKKGKLRYYKTVDGAAERLEKEYQ